MIALLKGNSFKNIKLEIIDVEGDIITLKRQGRTYKIRKVDRKPKRWDFVFFKDEDYQSKWFIENKGNFFLVKKSDSSYVYFDDINGFDCYLHKKHCETYEVLERM